MSTREESPRTLLAVATADPLGVKTFSGLSHRLFAELARQSVTVIPLRTSHVTPRDAIRGAISGRGILDRTPLARQLTRRRAPLVKPSWHWSRKGFELASARFDREVQRRRLSGPMLQVGTHVTSRLPQLEQYCITDCTVTQALEAGMFTVSRTDPQTQAEAVQCQRQVFEACTRIFTLSSWAAESVVRDYGISEERVVVVGAGANLTLEWPRTYDGTVPYVLFVGYDWTSKGGPLLLEAFRVARARVPSARMVVVGVAPDISEPGVLVVGPLDKGNRGEAQRLAELYSGASCLALLSEFDAFPNVILEAGYYGTPTVAFDEGSRAEVVRHGDTGLLVSREDSHALADALVDLLSDPSLVGSLGAGAHDLVLARYTWPAVAALLLDEIFPP